jgi:indolepyruvate ferredoxin oxidoreductase alpha subunit
MEKRTAALAAFSDACPFNRIEPGTDGGEWGVISQGAAYQYAREAFGEATFLKLGLSWPPPEALIRRLAGGVRRLLIVEELDALLERDVRAMGLNVEVHGADVLPRMGPLSVDALLAAREELAGRRPAPAPAAAEDLPARPPALCPGCPHRGVFYTLRQLKLNVMGDIGCYSLSVLPPLSSIDAIICMGAGFGAAQGMAHLGLGAKTVGVMGDSTFFHSGLTGLADAVYNQAPVTLLVLDNHTTAMTGHQPHPGTGKTLRGVDTHAMNIAAIAKAMGVRRVFEINAYDLAALKARLTEEVAAAEPSLIVVIGPCTLQLPGGRHTEKRRTFDSEKCRACRLCLNLGCPAIVLKATDGKTHAAVNETLCASCGLCVQVCPFEAIE